MVNKLNFVQNQILVKKIECWLLDVYHKSKKFIPLKKMDAELFSGSTNIESGPDFDKIFELDIEITGGDGKKIVFYE